jgi:cytochrome c556
MMYKLLLRSGLLAMVLLSGAASAQESGPMLTVKQLMNALLTPATNTIWGAYQLETREQWQEVENAALTVIAAAELLAAGGALEADQASAAEADWQAWNNDMIAAARQVLSAVQEQDEQALSEAGNNALYPPCESCHQQYQQR